MLFKFFKNPQIYTALIAAAVILLASALLKDTANHGFIMLIYVVVASLQIPIARKLTKSNASKCRH